jgi:ribosomal protein S18 acetylase RimI-like enzyme
MSNNAAVRFYERAGFEVSATKPDYPTGYTAYRMVKQLQGA